MLTFVIYKFDPPAVIAPTLLPLLLITPLRVKIWLEFAEIVLVPLRLMLSEIVSLFEPVDEVVVMFPRSMIEFPPKVKLPRVPVVALPVLEKVMFPIYAPAVKVLLAVILLLPVKVKLFVAVPASACVIATVEFIRDVDQFPLTLDEFVVRVLFHVKLPAA